MSLVGSIEHFNVNGGDFESYKERMEQLFKVNGTKEEEKGPLFITLIGPEAYKLLKNLMRPENPTTKAYKDMSEIEFLGHTLSKEGIKPLKSKVKEIMDAPVPTNLTQLKSFLGLLNFYSKFLPHCSDILSPLNDLLRKSQPFKWGKSQQAAFEKCKGMIKNCVTLTHYDPNKELIVAADASPYGLGAILSLVEDGVCKPIQFASCTLSPSERNYAQVQREAYAVVFAVRKFHKFLYGRKFTILSDHQPLKTIFGEKQGLPTLAHARIQRWAVTLSAYNYEIKYKKASEMSNVDCLSRLPLSEMFEDSKVEDQVFAFTYEDNLPITAELIREETKKDKCVSEVIENIKHGWSYCNNEELKPYFQRRNELSVECDCLTWGNRVVIPESLRGALLEILHESHPGIVRMKLRARSDFWWPNIHDHIEQFVNQCQACQILSNREKNVSISAWEKSERNFSRIHVDFFDLEGYKFFLMIDTTSKWLEIFRMNGTNALKTIVRLREVFSRFGLPEVLVADNNPLLTVTNFINSVDPMEYMNTPSTVTMKSPAELLFKQVPRTKLNMFHPKYLKGKVERKREQVVAQRQNKGRRENIMYLVNQSVMLYMTQLKKWVTAKVLKAVGINSYLVMTSEGRVRYVHADHLKPTFLQFPEIDVSVDGSGKTDKSAVENFQKSDRPESNSENLHEQKSIENQGLKNNEVPPSVEVVDPKSSVNPITPIPKSLAKNDRVRVSSPKYSKTSPSLVRKSQRVSKAPDRLDL
ncbi:retrovirus-related Pol polyprotein from transposon 297 [Leptinotarsa decemlineata]|uniref:retrovirus-related Pol polyprotein from transposon 297 n=1 Tax=Leptinotarsa decemlineata TaxID=7539 RepID=UPI003D304214